MGHYIEVSDSTFKQEVLESDVPVLVDFWAPWCAPCRAIAPHVEAIGQEYAGSVKVAKVNVDNNQRIASQYGIRGIPALLVFKNGKVATQMQGMPPNARDKLRQLVNSVMPAQRGV
ncbi:MAG: thioredoxin [Myxococcales bacterium]|nr:thioredoxin [Myxococcales bacterium]